MSGTHTDDCQAVLYALTEPQVMSNSLLSTTADFDAFIKTAQEFLAIFESEIK